MRVDWPIAGGERARLKAEGRKVKGLEVGVGRWVEATVKVGEEMEGEPRPQDGKTQKQTDNNHIIRGQRNDK